MVKYLFFILFGLLALYKLCWLHGNTKPSPSSVLEDRIPVAVSARMGRIIKSNGMAAKHKTENIQPVHADKICIKNHPFHITSLPYRIVSEVEKFVFFIGWSRSGHTVISAMLDAHPNIIMGRRFLLFNDKYPANQMILHGKNESITKTYLFSDIYCDSAFNTEPSVERADLHAGYNFSMTSAYQGRFTELKVVGVKEAGWISEAYINNPMKIQQYYQALAHTLQIPIKVLFVIRNPYDMIATALCRAAGENNTKVAASKDNPYNDPIGLRREAWKVFGVAAATQDMIRTLGLDVLMIYHEDHVQDSKGTMQRICNFLDVEYSQDYLQRCYDRAFKTLSKSRETVVWSKDVLWMVKEGIKKYPFFHRYTFNNDY